MKTQYRVVRLEEKEKDSPWRSPSLRRIRFEQEGLSCDFDDEVSALAFIESRHDSQYCDYAILTTYRTDRELPRP